MSADLRVLVVRHLGDIFGARRRVARALPGLGRQVTDRELRAALAAHEALVQLQTARVERCFMLLGVEPRGRAGDGVEGLIARAGALASRIGDARLRDVETCADMAGLERHETQRHDALLRWLVGPEFDGVRELVAATRAECADAARRFEATGRRLARDDSRRAA